MPYDYNSKNEVAGYRTMEWRKLPKKDVQKAEEYIKGEKITWSVYDLRKRSEDTPKSKSWRAYCNYNGKTFLKFFSEDYKAKQWCENLTSTWKLAEHQLHNAKTSLTELELREAETAILILKPYNTTLTNVVNQWRKMHNTVKLCTLTAAKEQYIIECQQLNNRARTIKERKLTLERLCTRYGNQYVHYIDRDIIKEFCWQKLNGVSPSAMTTRNRLAIISGFLTWCVKNDYCPTNIALKIDKANYDSRTPVILNIQQAKALLEAAKTTNNGALVPYVSLLLFDGIRDAEASRIDWSHITLDENDSQISIKALAAKTRAPRQHLMEKNLVEILKQFNGVTIKPKNFTKLWRKVREKAGFNCARKSVAGKISWAEDATRHSCISYWLKLNQNRGEAAYRFGNSPAIIREHYEAHVSLSDAKEYFSIGLEGTSN